MSTPEVAATGGNVRGEIRAASGINSGNAAKRNRGMDTGFVARIGKRHHDRDVRDHEPRDPPAEEEPEADRETADDDREHRDEERHTRLAHVTEDGADVRTPQVDAVPPPP